MGRRFFKVNKAAEEWEELDYCSKDDLAKIKTKLSQRFNDMKQNKRSQC